MAEKYSFFNSKEHDRKYNAKDWADYFYPLFKSGVFNGDLQVVANGGMQIKVKTGYAWIDGYGYHLTDVLKLDLETASGNMNRMDSVVIRLDLTNRWIKAFCKTGNYYAEIPTPPVPEITATIHEIVIAHISVAAGVTEITQDMIEDTRMDDALCGWVCGAVKQIEFRQIYEQFTAFQKKKEEETRIWMDKNKEWTDNFQNNVSTEFWKWFSENTGNWNQEIQEWFNNIKEKLSENEAINLQNQIGNLKELNTEDKGNIVAAINETKQLIRPPVNNFLTTEPGSPLDAAIAPIIREELDNVRRMTDKLNSNLSELIAKVNVRVRLIAGNIKSNADGTFTFTHNLNFKGGYVCIAGFGGPTTDYVTINMADANIVYGTIRHTDGTGYAVTTALVFVLIGN